MAEESFELSITDMEGTLSQLDALLRFMGGLTKVRTDLADRIRDVSAGLRDRDRVLAHIARQTTDAAQAFQDFVAGQDAHKTSLLAEISSHLSTRTAQVAALATELEGMRVAAENMRSDEALTAHEVEAGKVEAREAEAAAHVETIAALADREEQGRERASRIEKRVQDLRTEVGSA